MEELWRDKKWFLAAAVAQSLVTSTSRCSTEKKVDIEQKYLLFHTASSFARSLAPQLASIYGRQKLVPFFLYMSAAAAVNQTKVYLSRETKM